MQEQGQYCPQCGNWLAPDEAKCQNCARRQGMSSATREWVLLLTLALLLPAFAVTGLLSRTYHARESAMSQRWFAEGVSDLRDGQASRAVRAFRNSLTYDPADTATQLKLAQALIANGHDTEAQTYLESLLARDAGNGPANLERARLAARESSGKEALRYYHNAIYGDWPPGQAQEPLRVREELCKFLLDRGDLADAEAELISLAAATPPGDSATHLRTGQLFLRAGNASRAMGEFQAVLAIKADDGEALNGAGTAAMSLGMFHMAQRYLLKAGPFAKNNITIQDALKVTQTVMDADPFERDLPKQAVIARTQTAFHAAVSRLRDCMNRSSQPGSNPAAGTELQTITTRVTLMTPWTTDVQMRAHPERAADLMGLVFDIEKLTARECGMPTGVNLTLLELARMPREELR
jgi:Tfp pilus assembly protein PilF